MAPQPTPLDDAARATLIGLTLMRPRLAHGYGCASEYGGPCNCGFAELSAGMAALITALEPPAAAPAAPAAAPAAPEAPVSPTSPISAP